MIRKIIQIDQEKCNGCGLCAAACHESAIGMVEGKARLLRDDYCDGLGDCLPACPTGAITFVEREALPYDQAAVERNKQAKDAAPAGGCPGSRARVMQQNSHESAPEGGAVASRLRQWPVQMKLTAVNAPVFQDAHLLIAADCAAYAYGDFHRDFMQDRVTLIGCPKLDGVDYSAKLTEILRHNAIRSVTVTRMEVPCCGGLEMAVRAAIRNCGRPIPLRVAVLSTDGKILEQREER